jgi:hypothetical protein
LNFFLFLADSMFSDYALEFFELDEAVLGAVEGGGDG